MQAAEGDKLERCDSQSQTGDEEVEGRNIVAVQLHPNPCEPPSSGFRTVPGCPFNTSTVILDVRSSHDFEAGHLPGAYNIPWVEIRNRGFELPPRSVPMLVCCEDDASTAGMLATWFETRTSKCIWNVEVVKFCPKTVQHQLAVSQASAVELGPSSQGHFLFCISPLLAESRGLLEMVKRLVQNAKRTAGQRARPRALDLGCGSGRDAIHLAAAGWHVTALDRDRKALRRLEQLADRQGLLTSLECVHANLEQPGDVVRSLTEEGESLMSWDVVTMCRYLHRPTLPELAEIVAPGGLLLLHTFMEGCSHPTDPRSILKRGELKGTFPSLTVVRDEVCEIDDGRQMSFFVARAPGSL